MQDSPTAGIPPAAPPASLLAVDVHLETFGSPLTENHRIGGGGLFATVIFDEVISWQNALIIFLFTTA
jgi:hypothetical protein